eukprot:364809-Chlamydomonas_euryale.AAC.18
MDNKGYAPHTCTHGLCLGSIKYSLGSSEKTKESISPVHHPFGDDSVSWLDSVRWLEFFVQALVRAVPCRDHYRYRHSDILSGHFIDEMLNHHCEREAMHWVLLKML